MKQFVVNGIVALHRAIFTAAAALLGVGGSLVAENAKSVSTWLLFVGSALLMYFEDVCGKVETDSHKLARTSDKPLRAIRVDVFNARRPVILLAVLAVAAGTLVGSVVVSLTDRSDRKITRAVTPPKPSPVTCTVGSGKHKTIRCRFDGRPVPVLRRASR